MNWNVLWTVYKRAFQSSASVITGAPLTRGFVIRRHGQPWRLIVGSSFRHETDFQQQISRCNCCLRGLGIRMKGSARIRASEWVSMYLHPARMLCQPANWFRLSGSVEKLGFARSCVGLLSFGLSLHPLICSHSANRWYEFDFFILYQAFLFFLSIIDLIKSIYFSFSRNKGSLLKFVLVYLSISNLHDFSSDILLLLFSSNVSYSYVSFSSSFYNSKLNLSSKKISSTRAIIE